MHRLMVAILVVALLGAVTWAPVAQAAPEIKVVVDGRPVSFDVPPALVQGRTLVPVRFVAQELGAQVDWEAATRTVTVHKGTDEIAVQVGQNTARVNGVAYQLDVSARMVRGRVLVPVRFFSELLGAAVAWDVATNTVFIITGRSVTPADMWITGYLYGANSLRSVQENLDMLTGIFPFAYIAQADGSIGVDPVMQNPTVGWQEAENLARQKGIPMYASISQHSRDILQQLLFTGEARDRFVAEAFKLVVDQGYQGLNLDFEQVPASVAAREAYDGLVQELAARLHGAGLELSLAVPAKVSDDVAWQLGYDYAGLGRYADYVVIMAYDEHHAGGEPGPVASLPWVQQVAQYAASQIPPEKILLGVGVYGYDWGASGNAKAVDLLTAQTLAMNSGAQVTWDATAYVPHFTYWDAAGVKHEVWYEDPRSLAGKLEVGRANKLSGIAIWRLGMVAPEMWQVIRGSLAPLGRTN
ncbi:MAG: hypothetical protein D9V47_00455 [Clostridia bacterium]|nr:MAG: hypothetical protein D9V47_00455 [Clostridia bacterium]